MDIKSLKYFMAVAEEGSFSSAAERLRVSQPNLSRQIARLEKILGKKLFQRHGRGVELTDDGMLLKKRAEEILAMVDATVAEVSASSDQIVGEIRIGSGDSRAVSLIFDAARRFSDKNPGTTYRVRSGNGDEISEWLDAGLIDVGIVVEPIDKVGYDFIRIPATDMWGILMKRDSPLAEKDVITPKDLEGLPLIISSQAMRRNELSAWMDARLDSQNVIATYTIPYFSQVLVECGLGYAFSLEGVVNTTGMDLCFRPLYPPIETGMVVVWKRGDRLPRVVKAFLEELRLSLSLQ